ncbi:YwqG family protein [Microbulbifer sp. SSSA005]|uniref:YwqG family protein n=1 Tax=unclassified Microbulbifer TaxID=2619833 RepID=UPI00403B13EA
MNEKIQKLGIDCLRILSSDKETASFLGGLPLTRTSIDWPRKNDKPLGFIAQFDLEEINPEKVIDWLPSHGRLLFFYDLEEWPWGFDPKDRGGWAVIYESGDGDFQSTELPDDLNEDHVAPEIKYVISERFTSFPDSQRISFEKLGLSEDEEYYEFLNELYGDEPRHQVSGFPSPIQNDSMEEECQLVSGGVNCGGPEGYNSKEAKLLREQENDWRLLFQFDSDDDIEIMWGDLGMLYFWVKESEARNANFSNAWLVLQCG